jgi:hypothetical protein
MNPTIKDRHSPVSPAGARKTAGLAALETGARILQDASPLKDFDVYVVGFHCARDEPAMQMEAHHYCRVVNDDLLQCVIFDGNTRTANLIGIEYIVSEMLFETLPEGERAYWHPHNYEILGGSLVAPGLPDAAEKAFLARLLNSYGKTWHTWHTGRHDQGPGDDLPLGDARLMWSFNRDGETQESLERNRQEALGDVADVTRKRERRRDLVGGAHPQRGVDLLRDHFPGSRPVPGVRDAGAPDRMDERPPGD